MKKSVRYVLVILIGLVIFFVTLLVLDSRGSLPDLIFQRNGDCQVSVNSNIPEVSVTFSDKKALCNYLNEWGVLGLNGYSYATDESPRNPASVSELQINFYDQKADLNDFVTLQSFESKLVNFAVKRSINEEIGILDVYIRPDIINSEDTELALSSYLLRVIYLTNVTAERSYSREDINIINGIIEKFELSNQPFISIE